MLNLIFSIQAAYTAPIIIITQNRQEERDRIHAKADFITNVKAKKEIEKIQVALKKQDFSNITAQLEEIKKLLTKK